MRTPPLRHIPGWSTGVQLDGVAIGRTLWNSASASHDNARISLKRLVTRFGIQGLGSSIPVNYSKSLVAYL